MLHFLKLFLIALSLLSCGRKDKDYNGKELAGDWQATISESEAKFNNLKPKNITISFAEDHRFHGEFFNLGRYVKMEGNWKIHYDPSVQVDLHPNKWLIKLDVFKLNGAEVSMEYTLLRRDDAILGNIDAPDSHVLYWKN